MSTIANIVVGLIALVHVYILVLEMFLWDKPAGLRAFGQTKETATASKVLAANQGLYNGFLAAGLFWGSEPRHGRRRCEGVFPWLRPDRGSVWRGYRQPQDSLYPSHPCGHWSNCTLPVMSA